MAFLSPKWLPVDIFEMKTLMAVTESRATQTDASMPPIASPLARAFASGTPTSPRAGVNVTEMISVGRFWVFTEVILDT